DRSQAAALRRPLHTLKGGARMAGIVAMGELSHELESLITRIEVGLVSSDESARSLARQALDELAKMRDAIAEGRPAASAPLLIARIQSAGAVSPLAPAAESQPMDAASEAVSAEIPIRFDSPPEAVPETMLSAESLWPLETPEQIGAPEIQASAPVEPPSVSLEALLPPEPTVMLETLQPIEPPVSLDSLLPTEPPASLEFLTPIEPLAQFLEAPLPSSELPAPAALLPPGREPVAAADRVEMARVSAELLDQLLNNAGEVSIARARLEQQLGSIEFNLGELSRTVTRLKEQLRKLEIETEAQILHRHENDAGHRQDFDPLELDRYSAIQQFSRALAESANDVASIQGLLENLIGEAQNLLQQQSRTVTELQNGLMRTRMVSLQRHVPRLARIVRQSAADTGKRAELIIDGASGELDRQVLERMLPPFEHMLRNAMVHGIESPEVRRATGKDESGHIHLNLRREGAEVIVEVNDDGAGMNLGAI